MFHAKPSRKSNAKKSAKKSAKTSTRRPSIPSPNPPTNLPVSPLDAFPALSLNPPPPYALSCPPGHEIPQQPPPRPPKVIIPTSLTEPRAGPPKTTYSIVARKVSPRPAVSRPAREVLRSSSNGRGRVRRISPEPVADEALCNLISSKLDAVITSIDGEAFAGEEQELEISEDTTSGIRGGWGITSREVSRGANKAISSAVVSTNYFDKVNLYTNSRLPPKLPTLKLYIPSYPLLCLAAQYSLRTYTKPTGNEREAFVDGDWRMGTKAMVIKSLPIDNMNCVVFAIRGSQTFTDWAVNLKSAPLAPTDFLDDPGNLCHSGFLSVARKMVKPVAARLRSLLEENPSRSSCSLLMTGHSAGGAVASLLYAHMLAEVARSELNVLTGCFKRIHCLTFGTPPISLLPLKKPPTLRHKKSLFMSFINEGDPVPRADKAYVRSLLRLYASPAPGNSCIATLPALKICKTKRPKLRTANSAPAAPMSTPIYTWNIPPGTLSNAGRLVVLRQNQTGIAGLEDDVKAEITSDEQLRSVVFGDPVMHMMKIYARRVEVLATKAVTTSIWG